MASPDEMVRAIARLSARHKAIIASAKGQEPVARADDQAQALVDAARALTGARVAYALIGGYAVGIYSGEARATNDVDIAVPTATNRDRLIEIMGAAGFRLRGTHEHSVNFLHANGEPVQLAMDVSFDEPIQRASPEEIMGEVVLVVGREDLLDMKRRSAADPRRRSSKAHQDRADIDRLLGDVPDPDEGW